MTRAADSLLLPAGLLLRRHGSKFAGTRGAAEPGLISLVVIAFGVHLQASSTDLLFGTVVDPIRDEDFDDEDDDDEGLSTTPQARRWSMTEAPAISAVVRLLDWSRGRSSRATDEADGAFASCPGVTFFVLVGTTTRNVADAAMTAIFFPIGLVALAWSKGFFDPNRRSRS